ncbi:condensation domain-containing protein [Nocardiopsis sp. CA-288880]|uniref:condensation domain-containing protein n=1 Tax=Nocardiopsis sp. CA-288880 TaxID=3239995 RepID=UPI003D99AFAC
MTTETVWPASIWQRYVLASEKRRPGTGTGVYFSVNAVLEFAGPLCVPTLTSAFRELVRRHELLRTRLVVDRGSEPLQVVRSDSTSAIELVDEDDVLAAEGWSHAPVRQERSPLSARLARRGPEAHVFSLHLHHLVSDPTTLWGVLGELAALYTAALGGADVPPAPAQYREYAVEELRRSGSDRDAAERWWSSAVGRARFASVRPGPESEPFAFREEFLAPDLRAAAERLARTYRGTLFVVLLAALACAMDPHVGDGDHLVFSTMFARRDRPRGEMPLGPCMVPAYIPVPRPTEGLSEAYAGAVRDGVLGSRRHSLLPTEAVRSMNPAFEDPENIVPFFEYLPLPRPRELAFGPVKGHVVDAAGSRDTGLARHLGIRARPASTGALVAHFSADGRGWTAPLTREVRRALGEVIDSAARTAPSGTATADRS